LFARSSDFGALLTPDALDTSQVIRAATILALRGLGLRTSDRSPFDAGIGPIVVAVLARIGAQFGTIRRNTTNESVWAAALAARGTDPVTFAPGIDAGPRFALSVHAAALAKGFARGVTAAAERREK
jgi:hypothetical protein